MSTKAKIKLVQAVPEPPQITDALRSSIASESTTRRAEMAKKVAAIESVTEEDLRIRAR